jgi:hypothetical protein
LAMPYKTSVIEFNVASSLFSNKYIKKDYIEGN